MNTGIDNLFACGKRLNLKNQVISSGAIYYHKFLKNLNENQNQKSVESIDESLIACTCLYLASKVEENPIKLKELLCTFYECLNKNDELSFDKFQELTNSVTFCEILICQLINFELNNELAHSYLLHYLKSFNEWLFDNQDESIKFSNLAWSLLIDFYRVEDCIQNLRPQEIAIAILRIAIRVFKDKLEQNYKSIEQILDFTNKFYEQLDKDNLDKINFVIMRAFQFKL